MSITKTIMTLFLAVGINAAERINPSAIFIPRRLGDVRVYKTATKFLICRNGSLLPVNTYDVCPKLRELLKCNYIDLFFEAGGHLSVDEVKEGDSRFFVIRTHWRD